MKRLECLCLEVPLLRQKVIGGTKFYDRREVKDLLAYLRAVANPEDEVSLKRILNVPKRGIGDTSVGKLDAYAASHALPFYRALEEADAADARIAAARTSPRSCSSTTARRRRRG